MINLRHTLNLAKSIMETNNIPYALIGGFALAVYGSHRATTDIDLIAEGSKRNEILKAFLENGFTLRFESQEVLQFADNGYVDILLANRPLSREMIKNAKVNKELGIYVVTVEDIIGLKIQAFKNDSSRELQDKADIQNLMDYPNLDLNKVKFYADMFDVWNEIKILKRGT